MIAFPPDAEPAPDELRATAARLRDHGREIDRVLAELAAHDRPDVWRGRKATAFSLALHRERRRISGLGGASMTLSLVADAVDRRAAGIELLAWIPDGLGAPSATRPHLPSAPDSP